MPADRPSFDDRLARAGARRGRAAAAWIAGGTLVLGYGWAALWWSLTSGAVSLLVAAASACGAAVACGSWFGRRLALRRARSARAAWLDAVGFGATIVATFVVVALAMLVAVGRLDDGRFVAAEIVALAAPQLLGSAIVALAPAIWFARQLVRGLDHEGNVRRRFAEARAALADLTARGDAIG